MTMDLAGCVILDDYGRILLIHRPSRSQWELPSGKVEEEEPPEAAAVRELYEELGVKVRLIKSLGNEIFEEDDIEYRYYWFQAEIIGGNLLLVEDQKFDDFDYCDIEDLLSLALSANMQVLADKILSGEVVFSAS